MKRIHFILINVATLFLSACTSPVRSRLTTLAPAAFMAQTNAAVTDASVLQVVEVPPPMVIMPPTDYATRPLVHTTSFKRVELTTLKPEADGVRLVSISDGIVTVRFENGYVIAAPAQKGAIFRYASHGYTGYTGIPLVEVEPDAGRVVLSFETRIYRHIPAE